MFGAFFFAQPYFAQGAGTGTAPTPPVAAGPRHKKEHMSPEEKRIYARTRFLPPDAWRLTKD